MDDKLPKSLFCLVIVLSSITCIHAKPRASDLPHIIFIIADDLGWADVNWEDPNLHSPNLYNLATNGIVLNNSYDVVHMIIGSMQPAFLPENVTTLPQGLKDVGYATHAIGKWHLGFCNWKYTPTFRGFDSFYGYYNADEDYYRHEHQGFLDFRLNEGVEMNDTGVYSTFAFSRRAQDILETHNTSQPLFLYLAFQAVHFPLENGGDPNQGASNWPLEERRLPSGRAELEGRDLMMHIVDWFPTLMTLVGGKTPPGIDGVSQWESLVNGGTSPRTEFVYNIDEINQNAAIRVGDWKLIQGSAGNRNGWYPPPQLANFVMESKDFLAWPDNYSLFNINEDPLEMQDVASLYPDLLASLKTRLEEWKATLVPANFPPDEPLADPENYGGWADVNWEDPNLHSPNLYHLAHNGIILGNSYVQPVCSPWHLGFCNWKYTPRFRGFDSFYGYYNAGEDYYNHVTHAEIDNYIVNGYVVNPINSFPWQLSLQRDGSHICGAVVYNNNFALTAAHCVAGVAAYSPSTSGFPNDIAVLALSPSLTLDRYCQPPNLPSPSDYAGQSAVITGWGRLYGGGTEPSRLKRGDVEVLSNTKCRTYFGNTISAAYHICVKDLGDRIYGGCNGDSGGPASVGNTVVGLASFVASGCLTKSLTSIETETNVKVHAFYEETFCSHITDANRRTYCEGALDFRFNEDVEDKAIGVYSTVSTLRFLRRHWGEKKMSGDVRQDEGGEESDDDDIMAEIPLKEPATGR
ncbi:hypothetical protein C0Q70_04900 [Pomacea canaliculata]|uniref:Peptidase S1 domain-containing protein n=1 Tax=Pomacea canaliculata TaxID=400727 RepID=A0A2T7PJS4_POMCA|nr:hypothetical protein C0Q70_04900 [Pomacea canaliculata]